MLKGENIIIFSFADWKSVPGSPQHISTELAKENRVLFIETFGSRIPVLEWDHIMRLKSRIGSWFRGIGKEDIRKNQLYIYSPVALMINAKLMFPINRRIFVNILKKLIKKLDMPNPILYFYLPPPAGAIDKLRRKAVIYDCVDEWLTFPAGKNKFFIDAERELIEKADLVLAANNFLYERKKPHARRIHKIYHGVDYGHFSNEAAELPIPEDIKNVKKPVLAIVGTFADWMDMDLIAAIAQRHKECSIISIGPVESNVDIRNLADAGNISFLGRKDYNELPNYYRAIDAFIVPFRLTEHIKTCAPIRLFEHLSSGKPIVATDFPAAREIGEGLIYIAADKEDFIRKVEAALKEKDASLIKKRKALAEKNTWSARVEERSRLIGEIIEEKKRAKKVKVLYLITRFNVGGALDVALSLAKGIDKNRFAVTFASGPQDFSEETKNKWNMKVVVFSDLVREISPLKDLKALIQLYLFIKKNKFDIVHTHTSKAGILGRIAAKLAGVGVTFDTPHGGIFHPIFCRFGTTFFLSRIIDFAARFTDKIITCSDYERKEFLKHKIASRGKYITMNWGSKREAELLKAYDRTAKRRELAIAQDAVLIGLIARLVPQKGHLFCLEAFKMIAERFPKAKLLIVGDGILRPQIESKIKELGLSNNVVLTGDRDDIPQILASLDICLHPSIWEGLPIGIIEAMLMGKAIVATAVGGIPEMIEDGVTGLLVPCGDKEALARAVIALINDKSLANKIGAAACRYAKENFSMQLMIKNTENLYNSYLDKN